MWLCNFDFDIDSRFDNLSGRLKMTSAQVVETSVDDFSGLHSPERLYFTDFIIHSLMSSAFKMLNFFMSFEVN